VYMPALNNHKIKSDMSSILDTQTTLIQLML
jgi:hypothetical protein